jgi:hypothetical protein
MTDDMSVYGYFERYLPRAPIDKTLQTLPCDSACGEDCVEVIDAACALLTFCDRLTHDKILAGVEQAISIKWHG